MDNARENYLLELRARNQQSTNTRDNLAWPHFGMLLISRVRLGAPLKKDRGNSPLHKTDWGLFPDEIVRLNLSMN